MYLLKHFLYLFLFFALMTHEMYAQTHTHFDDQPGDPITEIILKNGLRVCLKKSHLEPNEFDFQLFALGGFGHLPVVDQPSAWLAAEIAWESGLDHHLSGDELECALDDHSVDMDVKLGLFDRQIKASGPMSELTYCLRLAKLFFTQPQFNESGWREALAHARQKFQKKERANKVADEQTALKINLKNWYTTTPFNPLDLGKVELHKAKEIFTTFFQNPAEFTLVIVGDFDHQEVLTLLEESLGSLPSRPMKQWNTPAPPSFPEGITKREFSGVTRYRDSLTRLTFPLCAQARDPLTLDLLCFILKQELISESAPGELEKNCFNVSYSFPLFPYLEPCWLVVKFSSPPHHIPFLCQKTLKKIEQIKQEGISEKTMKIAFQELAKKRTHIADNAYILSLFVDYYRAGWDVKQLDSLPNQEQQKEELVKKVIDYYPNLNQYSVISLHPLQ